MKTVTEVPEHREWRLLDRDDVVVEFVGRHIGSGTSERANRERWFEVDLYKTDDDMYVVVTRGHSRVPGEMTKRRIVMTLSAFEVVELLTVKRDGRLFLPVASIYALSQAAQWDDDIRDAYVNRAV